MNTVEKKVFFLLLFFCHVFSLQKMPHACDHYVKKKRIMDFVWFLSWQTIENLCWAGYELKRKSFEFEVKTESYFD